MAANSSGSITQPRPLFAGRETRRDAPLFTLFEKKSSHGLALRGFDSPQVGSLAKWKLTSMFSGN